MPTYEVEAIERWVLRTLYLVEAASDEEAEAKARSGHVPCAHWESSESPPCEEWLETVCVEEMDA